MKQRFVISSRYRSNLNTSGTSCGDCQIDLGTNSLVAGKYAVTAGSITNSVYTITSSTNTLIFTDNALRTATLTPGYYTGVSLATEIQTQLTAGGGDTYTVTFSQSTGKLTLDNLNHFIILTYAGSTCAPIIGLIANQNVVGSSMTLNQTIDLTYNFSGAFIRIANASSFNKRYGNSSSNDYNVYLAIDQPYGSTCVFKDIEVPALIELTGTSRLDITIYNTVGAQVNMNGGYLELELMLIEEKKESGVVPPASQI